MSATTDLTAELRAEVKRLEDDLRVRVARQSTVDREWLQQAISYLAGLPSTHALVDETSPLWLVTPSGDAATRLLDFWRERDEAGELVRDLHDETLDTRFLGDLYQDLSEEARSRYA